ncbi:HYC_CC_PP family protein [Aridibaculum aurantiacum]|uniref:HYC_CC_PP family protein n=1 Tax=Aridibaculum aurantiacum TaxID=2810307 RepID=UPI001A97C27B|nr:hypothetical protein [Aridibaculum aurantiacum]
MKRFIVLILSILYLGTSVGATFNMHYCMGKLVDVSLFADEGEDCSSCGMEKAESNNSCCKDEHKELKVQDDQKITPGFTFFPLPPVAYIPTGFSELPGLVANSVELEFPVSHAPPLQVHDQLYLLNCNFRI